MAERGGTDDETDEEVGDVASVGKLVPEDEVVESIPILGLDTSDDAVLLPLLGDVLATGDGHKESGLGALLVDLRGHGTGSLPLLGLRGEVLFGGVSFISSQFYVAKELRQMQQLLTSSVHFLR